MEEYRTIKEYENYEISNKGNIRNKTTKQILKPTKDKKGYLIINIQKNGKGENKRVHRLVAQEFIENQSNKPIVDHIDNNRSNNNVENLRWCTSCENSWNRTSFNKNGKGVYYIDHPDEKQPKYYATIFHKGTKYDLGMFWSKEEAQKVRYEKEKELFGEFMNKKNYKLESTIDLINDNTNKNITKDEDKYEDENDYLYEEYNDLGLFGGNDFCTECGI